jgi:hypothetical protein
MGGYNGRSNQEAGYGIGNRRWVEWQTMAYHRVDELGELLSVAGYSGVQIFEAYERGWL